MINTSSMVPYVYCSNLSPHHYLPTQKNEKEIIKVRKVNVNKVGRQIIIYLLCYLFLNFFFFFEKPYLFLN